MQGGYYDIRAEDYFAATASADMGVLYDRFLPTVRSGGTILDAGCGSGRDAREFRLRGFSVVAFDASLAMASLASKHIGQHVSVMRFQDMQFRDSFDGIWTCASLLHVPRAEMPDVLRRLEASLRVGGAWFMAFKRGGGQRIAADGRLFTDYTPETLRNELVLLSAISVIDIWETQDVRVGRTDTWVNCLAVKI